MEPNDIKTNSTIFEDLKHKIPSGLSSYLKDESSENKTPIPNSSNE